MAIPHSIKSDVTKISAVKYFRSVNGTVDTVDLGISAVTDDFITSQFEFSRNGTLHVTGQSNDRPDAT